ncbi:MAG: TatD family hydrolase [Syntrophorhabdaceae bacterium]|nr:TatD family hydrolase [Syntrophorhabdaceae bacterium]
MSVDSHSHLEMETFDRDRKQVIERALQAGLSHILTVGTEERYFKKVIEIVEGYGPVFGAIGIHPHNSTDFSEGVIDVIRTLCTHRKIVAYGEIGLDFYKNYSPRDTQLDGFKRQIELAIDLDLPVIIHSRQAAYETVKVLKDVGGSRLKGVIHCFSYDYETAKKFVNMGYYISFPGTITYPDGKKAYRIIKDLPLDRILAETDCPFLTPVPHRGKRNEPSYVIHTIGKIAEVRGMDVKDLSRALLQNFYEAFPKTKGV